MESDTAHGVPLVAPAPAPAPNPSGHRPLVAAKSTAFKREERRRRKDRKRQERLALELARWEPLGAPPPRPASTASTAQPDTPWPCDPPPPPEPSSWSWGPPATPGPAAVPPPPTVAAASAPHPQAAAVRSCRAFFEAQVEDDGDEEEEEQEGEEGNAARFFAELLGGDAALRGFYEAEREGGLFLCLVCEGTGARVGKRFAGCAALVQHAGSVARTRRRLAHRAFADAVGRLLGWGAGRTAPPPADSQEGASDQTDHLCVPQSVEMEVS